RWIGRPLSPHSAIHVSPFGPARRISVPLPYRAPRCVRSTAALFVSDPLTTAPIYLRRCTTLAGSRFNSEQLVVTQKSRFCSANTGKLAGLEKLPAPFCGPGGRRFESPCSP